MKNTIEINDAEGNNVVSIELIRRSAKMRRIYNECSHTRVTIDEAFNEVECRDCGKHLNPVWVMAQWADSWSEMDRLRENYLKAAAEYGAKTRTKCLHCGQMTQIIRPPKIVKNAASDGGEDHE